MESAKFPIVPRSAKINKCSKKCKLMFIQIKYRFHPFFIASAIVSELMPNAELTCPRYRIYIKFFFVKTVARSMAGKRDWGEASKLIYIKISSSKKNRINNKPNIPIFALWSPLECLSIFILIWAHTNTLLACECAKNIKSDFIFKNF